MSDRLETEFEAMNKILLRSAALLILLVPLVILGWIGFMLLDWPGLALGLFIGVAVFVYNINRVAVQAEGLVTHQPIHPDASIATNTSESKQA